MGLLPGLLLKTNIFIYSKYGCNGCLLIELHREKTGFVHMRKHRRRSAIRAKGAVTAKLLSAFVFATRIVLSLDTF